MRAFLEFVDFVDFVGSMCQYVHIMLFMTHMKQVFTKRLGHSHHKIVSAEWQRTFLCAQEF